MRLLPSGGSRDRTKSPAPVSEKREYSGNRLETFGSSVAEDRKMGVWRRGPNAQTPLLAGFAAIPRDRSKKDGLLGWAGGFEPPYGGIKIHRRANHLRHQ
jgi:hypothetical protein